MRENLRDILLASIPFDTNEKFYVNSRKAIKSILSLGVSTVDEMANLAIDTTTDTRIREEIIPFLAWLRHESAIPDLVQLSQNTDESIELRRTAIIYLSVLGQQRVFQNIVNISVFDDNPEIRRSAISAFCVAPFDGAFDILVEAITNDKDNTVRIEAIRAISSTHYINYDLAFELLSSMYLNLKENVLVRAYAAEGLGYLEDKRALPDIISNLEHSSPAIRYMCAFAIGMLGDEAHIPLLEKLLTDTAIFPDWGTVSEVAHEAIHKITE